MRVVLGIKIVWSKCMFLPLAKNIMNGNYYIGYSNKYKDYTYRFYPYIKIVVINSKQLNKK